MITTPGEVFVGMTFTVLEGKSAVEGEDVWQESSPHQGLVFFVDGSRQPSEPDGIARLFVVRAVNLPMVLATDVVTCRPVVFDARKIVLREVSPEYAKEYVRLFAKPRKPKK